MNSPATGAQLAAVGAGNTLTFRSGTEVAAVVDALYLRLLVVGLGCVPLVCVLAVLVGLARTHNANFARTTALAIGLAALAVLALRARAGVYRAMRRRPWLSLVAPLVALTALAIDGVTYSPLSYPAVVSIAVPAFVCGRGWGLAGAAMISAGALASATAHNGAGALNAVGQGAVGYFVWAVVLAGLAELFARLAMQMPPAAGAHEPAASPVPVAIAGSSRDQPCGAPATAPGSGGPPARAASVTARQLQVLALLADGFRADDIAQRLGISTPTVYRHIERAKSRAGVRSRSELVAVVIREGILPSSAG